jgi:transcriptional regulator with XRE-family HTH domain
VDKKQIGRAVRKKRLQLGLTQSTVAQSVRVKPSYIARIENGKANFTIDKLLGIARVLRVPAYTFFHSRPLVPFKEKEPRLVFNSPEADYMAVKLFGDLALLGPGYEIAEMIPADYVPILREHLPEELRAEKDRVVAFPAPDNSMTPTINKGAILWIDRRPAEPRAGEVYAFWLRDPAASVTIKRLIHIDHHFFIIDGDSRNEKERASGDLRDYPRVLSLKDYEPRGITPVRGRVIWALNRLMDKPEPRKASEERR